MIYDVFISYSSIDQKVAEGVCGYLESRGIRCFVAYRDIPKGKVWAAAIVEALDDSQMMVVIFSQSFNLSEQVDREIELASEDKKPILTYRISNDTFKGVKKYYLKNINWIDAFPDPKVQFGTLYENICCLIGKADSSSFSNTIDNFEKQWDNKKNGFGTYVWTNGDKYEGQWKDGKRSGFGTYVWADGSKYEGQWKDDKKDGHGIYIWADGSEYDGQWKDDKKNGQGIQTWANGDKYDGQWKESKSDGHGIYIWASGSKYDGQWKDNKKDGHGIYIWADGTEYDGQWKDDKMVD